MRYILFIFSFFLGYADAQLYRVFFTDKGEIHQADLSDLPVPSHYIRTVGQHCDSVWMVSNWLNYALIESKQFPGNIADLSFVKQIEKVEPLKSTSLQSSQMTCSDGINEKDSVDPETMNKQRQWQLDTMGYQYFREKKIDGTGIVIAIIDAGFSTANESKAFSAIFSSHRVLKTYDFIDGDTNVFHGSTHGTKVWSCIAGDLNDQPTGLATNASFILLRSEDEKTETMADEDRWIQAIEMAYRSGAHIVNSSVGFTNVLHKKSDLNGKTLISVAADMAAKKGMLVVVSAGNEWITSWKTLAVPADAEGVITVGGIDKEGQQSYFSSVGPTADGRAKPDVVAPGTCVTVKGNSFVMSSGTSFSAPLVTGYMACMLQLKGKDFTKDSLKYYGGLYPYFDYVFGYGVPGIKLVDSNNIVQYTYDFKIDKVNGVLVENRYRFPVAHKVLLKITDINGVIKFSRRITIPKSCKYKVPRSGTKIPFNYSKCYSFSNTDTWSIWDIGDYFEF